MGSLIDEHVCLIGRGLEAILAMNTWCVPRVGFPVRAHCRVAKPGCRHPLSWKSKAFGAKYGENRAKVSNFSTQAEMLNWV